MSRGVTQRGEDKGLWCGNIAEVMWKILDMRLMGGNERQGFHVQLKAGMSRLTPCFMYVDAHAE